MYRSLMVAGCVLFAATAQLFAQERIALVIGNDAYQSVASVPGAQQDAQLVADGLSGLGFDVNLVINANLRFQRFSIQQYLDALQAAAPGSIGVVYYQGHGVAVADENYLLPPNIQVGDPDDIARTSIGLDWLLSVPTAGAQSQSVVILDCCAANPFDAASGVTGQGLVEVTAPEGVLLAYSTPAGSVAQGDSDFARTLIDGISVPGASVQDVLASLGPNYVSAGITAPIVLAVPQGASQEDMAWDAIKDSADPDAVLAFLEAYPDGTHADSAQSLIVDLLTAQLEVDAALAAQEPAAETPAPAAPAATGDIAQRIAQSDITFAGTLAEGATGVAGRSIEQLIAGTPLYPPIEGLPEALWKEQQCSNCHEWTQSNLCEQANFYLGDAGAENLIKQHPYGGTFKLNIAQWARGGCR